jgi:hypothetical protein
MQLWQIRIRARVANRAFMRIHVLALMHGSSRVKARSVAQTLALRAPFRTFFDVIALQRICFISSHRHPS